MKKATLLFSLFIFVAIGAYAQKYSFTGNWGKQGINLVDSRKDAVQVVYSVNNFELQTVAVEGQTMKNIILPGTFLFNDEGMPNLPNKGKYIAIPQGAKPVLKILSDRREILHNIEIAPAPRIPADNQPDFPLVKNQQIYSRNALYPESPVQMSEVQKIRGVDAVILGITPFQYNPVTKDLIIYKDLKVEITFENGNGQFGDMAYRNYWWDPILQDVFLNHASLPVVDYNLRLQSYPQKSRENECEYIIITPTGPDFRSWADSVKKFRSQQGILTKVFTIDEIGGNTVSAIESFIDNAYNSWTIKPVACLILGDNGTDGTKNITTQLWNDHPDGYNPYASDNKFADVDGDEMPEIIFSRITANDATQLQTMVTKFLEYERNPPTDSLFYDKPITALGWQTVRWFQLCSEIVGGYFKNVQGKHPRRINKVYEGNPGNVWSTAQNTNTIVNYFGTNGLYYIPTSPSTLGGWDGGNATMINNAVDSGAFILMHRDHGAYTAWGEPAYTNSNINSLNNTKLPFVFSINCQTGAYHKSTEVLGEKFHRHIKNGHNAGALGVVCPSEVSYSFVNDTYVWGMMDNMWPDFMPEEGTTPESRGVLPAFGHEAGKYFLKSSNWPYNTQHKQVTYRMFHMFGDAFQVIYFQVPQQLTVTHNPNIEYESTSFSVQANDSAFIALTVNDSIIATALGAGSNPVVIPIPVLAIGTEVLVTVTKQNYFRYSSLVPVTSTALIANFTSSATNLCIGSFSNFTDLSSGSPESWQWEFPGGTPSSSTEQNPADINYPTAGNYDVTLTIHKTGVDPSTTTKTAYIHVLNFPVSNFNFVAGCPGQTTSFTDQSDPNGGSITNWKWYFGDPDSGSNDSSTLQNPAHIYTNPGTYNVTLIVTTNGTCLDTYVAPVNILPLPGVAAKPVGTTSICKDAVNIEYTTTGADNASTYIWMLTPPEAGIIAGSTTTALVTLTSGYQANFTVKVEGVNDCGEGGFSEELLVAILPTPIAPVQPSGSDSVNLNKIWTSDFTISAIPDATSYSWFINPLQAGTISGSGLVGTVNWVTSYRGIASITATAFNQDCEGPVSEIKSVKLYGGVGIGENSSVGIEIYPNPTTGKINLDITANGNISANIKIYNVIGNIVYQEKDVKISGQLRKNIDLSSLSKGLYHFKIEGDGISVVKSFVIQK